jgi:hypothetical protein
MFKAPSAAEVLTQRKPFVNRRRVGAFDLRPSGAANARSPPFLVIPGRAEREPGIHNHRRLSLTARRPARNINDRGYGFRACAKKRIPE